MPAHDGWPIYEGGILAASSYTSSPALAYCYLACNRNLVSTKQRERALVPLFPTPALKKRLRFVTHNHYLSTSVEPENQMEASRKNSLSPTALWRKRNLETFKLASLKCVNNRTDFLPVKNCLIVREQGPVKTQRTKKQWWKNRKTWTRRSWGI